MSGQAPPPDPLTALTAALSQTADSPAQAAAFLVATDAFEAAPTSIESVVLPVLGSVLGTSQGSQDTLMRRWLLDMVFMGVGRSKLTMEQKTSIAEKSLSNLLPLLASPSSPTIKLVTQFLTCAYPLLFRQICVQRAQAPTASAATIPNPAQTWSLLSQAKHKIIGFALAISLEESTLGHKVEVADGVRVAAWKFVQRCIAVGTKGSGDPRLHNPNDPNLNMLPPNHSVINVQELVNETNGFLTQVELQFESSSDPSIIHALTNTIPPLIKSRPALSMRLIPMLSAWTPASFQGSNPPATLSQIRAVEKTLKIVMIHLERNPAFSAFTPQLRDALTKQGLRLYAAGREEKAERQVQSAARKARAAAGVTTTGESSKQARLRGEMSSKPEGGVAISVKKEDIETSDKPSPAKRPRIESPSQSSTQSDPKPKTGSDLPLRQAVQIGSTFDVSSLSLELAVDGVIAGLSAMSREALADAIDGARRTAVTETSAVWRALGSILGDAVQQGASLPRPSAGPQPMPSRIQEDEPDDMLLDPDDEDSAIPSETQAAAREDPGVKLEPDAVADPLAMLTDADEGLHEDVIPPEEMATRPTIEEEPAIDILPLRLAMWKLPPPPELSEAAALRLLEAAMKRIWVTGQEIEQQAFDAEDSRKLTADIDAILVEKLVGPKSAWMLLMTRLASRGLEDEEEQGGEAVLLVRRVLSRYIAEDFASRSSMAAVWLNEEWFSQKVKGGDKQVYNTWLSLLLRAAIDRKELGDKALSQFLTKVPEVPADTLEMLKGLCEMPETAITAFITLRDIISFRPPLREATLRILLDLTTHPDRKTRLLAINTVKRWVSGDQSMGEMIRKFALQIAHRLVVIDGAPPKLPEEDTVAAATTYLEPVSMSPVPMDIVKQHLELYLGLTHRLPSMLADLFDLYPLLQASEQQSVEELTAPLIRALRHARSAVLSILREFPPAAEKLALHIINTLAEGGSPGDDVTDLVKHLMGTRDLDARFAAPIAGEMDRAQLQRYLPRFIALLSGKPPEKDLVRQVIRSVVHVPTRMSGITNLKQERDTEKMSAADFLVLLHEQEKAIGVKAALEATDLCMTLGDLFPQEVLAVVMQRLAEEAELPILFMRTVLRAVTVYKSLTSYVSSTLLPRLISKKIWTQPRLWEGFILVAKTIAPASFTALLQLPKEQLKQILDKQPTLRPAVWQFLLVRSGPAKAQGYAELFGDVAVEAPAQNVQHAIPAFN